MRDVHYFEVKSRLIKKITALLKAPFSLKVKIKVCVTCARSRKKKMENRKRKLKLRENAAALNPAEIVRVP